MRMDIDAKLPVDEKGQFAFMHDGTMYLEKLAGSKRCREQRVLARAYNRQARARFRATPEQPCSSYVYICAAPTTALSAPPMYMPAIA